MFHLHEKCYETLNLLQLETHLWEEFLQWNFPNVLLLSVQAEFYESSVGRGASEPTNGTYG